MKKKLIIIGAIIAVIAIVICVCLFNKKDNTMVNKLDVINSNLEFISSLSKRYEKTGELEVTANYRGAHGENNPHDFNYFFSIENSKLYVGNDKGYSYLSDFKYLDMFNAIADMKNTFKVTKESDNKYSIDTKKLSDLLYKKIDSITLEVKNNENILTIKYDDKEETITFNEDFTNGRGTFFDKEIKYNKTSQGISLQYDVDFKMNVFLKDNYIEYSIVSGKFVYKLLLYDDRIEASVSGESAIYKGLDMTFKFNEGLRVEHDKTIDAKNICVTRYFNAMGKVGSEY